ncbi:MAG: ATP-binding protein [Gallionella sp.]
MTNEINCIQKVEISGLWDKYDFVWDLNSDVNILAGINGSGKSTVLNHIYGLMSARGYREVVAETVLSLDNKTSIKYKLFNVEDNVSNLRLNDVFKGAERANPAVFKSGNLRGAVASVNDGKMTLEELHSQINVNVISTFDNALKQAEAIQKLSDDMVKTELDWEIYQLQIQYVDYQLNLSKRRDAIIDENPDDLKVLLEKTKYSQAKFLEMIDASFCTTDKKINRNANQIEFLIGDKKIRPFQLSSGEKQLLIILLTVLIQDNKPSILLMDEPEISLHIDWQKKLIRHIRELNPNVQVIIATHSPALVMEGWQDKVCEMSDLLKVATKK